MAPPNPRPFDHTQDRFSHPADALRNIAQDMLDYAKQRGASAAAAEVSTGFGQAVTVRQGEVETIEYNRDKGLGITVYIGQQRGNASSSDFSPQAVRDTVDAALSIASYTAVDDCSGLPDTDMLARDFPDLDLYHPWDLPVDAAIGLARQCEQAALDTDKRISNSEGATVNLHESQFVFANSLGFTGGYPSSRHSLSRAVIAGQDDAMERDYWYAVARDATDLMGGLDVDDGAVDIDRVRFAELRVDGWNQVVGAGVCAAAAATARAGITTTDLPEGEGSQRDRGQREGEA